MQIMYAAYIFSWNHAGTITQYNSKLNAIQAALSPPHTTLGKVSTTICMCTWLEVVCAI